MLISYRSEGLTVFKRFERVFLRGWLGNQCCILAPVITKNKRLTFTASGLHQKVDFYKSYAQFLGCLSGP